MDDSGCRNENPAGSSVVEEGITQAFIPPTVPTAIDDSMPWLNSTPLIIEPNPQLDAIKLLERSFE